MEEQIQSGQETQRVETVGFPSQTSQSKESNGKSKVFIILGFIFLIVLAGGGFFVFKSASSEISPKPTSTPSNQLGFATTFPTSTPVAPSATPSSTPAPIKRAEIKIQILNGTGVTGEASYLQKQLEALGYEEITAGNASSSDETETTVTFKTGLNPSAISEITDKLKQIYTSVEVKTGTPQGGNDVSITTGPRKGSSSSTSTPKSSPKPSATPTPKSSPTPTPNS